MENNKLDNYKEKVIKEIKNNFDDMKGSLISNEAYGLIPLFRDYTYEIIKIIKGE